MLSGQLNARFSLTIPKRDLSNIETKRAVEALGRKATVYTADLSSPPSVAGIVPAVLKDGHNIQILINCAGINKRGDSTKFPDSDLNEVCPLFSAYNCCCSNTS